MKSQNYSIRILIPLPNKDFDLTEVAVPWKLFKDNGFEVVFTTENGKKAEVDPKLITGVIFGQLKASSKAISFFRKLEKAPEFLNPILYTEINPLNFNAIHLPGGHAKGMRQYLESNLLQQKVLEFYNTNKVIGSICHGSIVLARTINPTTNKSIIFNKNITGLIKRLEKVAYYITAWKLGDYYKTYPEYTEDEICRNLKNKNQFKKGALNPYKPFVCIDQNIISARWPEDVYLYVKTFIKTIHEKKKPCY